jgi:hypothetical protein
MRLRIIQPGIRKKVEPIEPVEHRGFTISQATRTVEVGGIVSHEFTAKLHISQRPSARIWNGDKTAFLMTHVASDDFRSIESAKAAIDFAVDHPFWCPVSGRELEKARRLGLVEE